jgi:ketosteroid isomerase-like protein
MTAQDSEKLARAWLEAFNRKDVEALLDLYAEHCTHTSPKIRVLHPETAGLLLGKPALRAWWVGALERIPSLRYEERALTCSPERAVLEYVRHAAGEDPLPVAEVFDLRGGKIVASRVFHG